MRLVRHPDSLHVASVQNLPGGVEADGELGTSGLPFGAGFVVILLQVVTAAADGANGRRLESGIGRNTDNRIGVLQIDPDLLLGGHLHGFERLQILPVFQGLCGQRAGIEFNGRVDQQFPGEMDGGRQVLAQHGVQGQEGPGILELGIRLAVPGQVGLDLDAEDGVFLHLARFKKLLCGIHGLRLPVGIIPVEVDLSTGGQDVDERLPNLEHHVVESLAIIKPDLLFGQSADPQLGENRPIVERLLKLNEERRRCRQPLGL